MNLNVPGTTQLVCRLTENRPPQFLQVLIPLNLHLLNRTQVFLKAHQRPALTQHFERALAILAALAFEQQVHQTPPVQVVKVEITIHGRAAAAREYDPERDHPAGLQAPIKVSTQFQILQPPDRIGVPIHSAHQQATVPQNACAEVFAQPFVRPLGEMEACHFLIQLMHAFVKHPVVRIDFISREIGRAIGRPVKGFGPPDTTIAASKFAPIPVKFQFEFGMWLLDVVEIPENFRVGRVERLHVDTDLLGLRRRRGRENAVVCRVVSVGWTPPAINLLARHDGKQQAKQDQQPFRSLRHQPGRGFHRRSGKSAVSRRRAQFAIHDLTFTVYHALAMSDTLVVNEIYLSLQGESTFAGLPCIFVRLTGCDLRCSYCDTAYAFAEGRKFSLADVRAEVRRLAAPFKNFSLLTSHFSLPLVELTGGEPLLQPNSLPLMKSLCDDGFTVLLETSGAHDVSKIDPRVHRIMDLKCPSSGEVARNRWENLNHLESADEIKFVVGTVEDYEWAKQQIAERGLAALCPLLFSWAHPLASAQQDRSLKKVPAGQTPMSQWELAERVIADALPVRFQTQLHKVIWPPGQRGV